MVLTIKHKLTIYKRFQQDIWGYCYSDLNCEKLLENPHVKLKLSNIIS